MTRVATWAVSVLAALVMLSTCAVTATTSTAPAAASVAELCEPPPAGAQQATVPAGPSACKDIPADLLALYKQAAPTCPGLSWATLAAVGKIESDHSRLPDTYQNNYAGAGGPMQFLQSTFDGVGVDGDGDGRADRMNKADAVFSAARYLCESGAGNPATLRQALYAYNHAWWYVDQVQEIQRGYEECAAGRTPQLPPQPTQTQAIPGKSLTGVHPLFAQRFLAYAAEVRATFGVQMSVNSAYRTIADQIRVSGQARPGYAAAPGSSPHGRVVRFQGQQGSIAIDHSPNSTPEMREIAKKHGLVYRMLSASLYEPWHVEPDFAQPGGGGVVVSEQSNTPAEQVDGLTGPGTPIPGQPAAPQPLGSASGAGIDPACAELGAGPPLPAGATPPAGVPPPSGSRAPAVTWALVHLNLPYCWAGNGPTCYDCSGFTTAALAAAGITGIPRTSEGQFTAATPVPAGQEQPGDLLFSEFHGAGPGHVGIVVGGGQFAHSPNSREVTKVEPYPTYTPIRFGRL